MNVLYKAFSLRKKTGNCKIFDKKLFIHPISSVLHWTKAKSPSSHLTPTEANEWPADRSDFGPLCSVSTLIISHLKSETLWSYIWECTGKIFLFSSPLLIMQFGLQGTLWRHTPGAFLQVSILHHQGLSSLVPYINTWTSNAQDTQQKGILDYLYFYIWMYWCNNLLCTALGRMAKHAPPAKKKAQKNKKHHHQKTSQDSLQMQ